MSALSIRQNLISPTDYLADEDLSETKNEYVDGRIFARAQSNYRHAKVGTNVLCALKPLLRGSRYRVLGCDARVHLLHGNHERFYYPDASVVGDGVDWNALFVDNPVVICADGWDVIRYNERTDTVPLPCIECELPLSEIYEE